MTEVHISVGAGFENDRRDLGVMAAKALAGCDGPKFLIFECLAERTLAKQVHANDLDGQIAHALSFVRPCLELCQKHDIKIISNFGGIDPRGVAVGLRGALAEVASIAAVTSDALPITPADGPGALARHVYTGAKGIADALAQGADIVVAGRVADPSLVVGPVVHSLGLGWSDWDALANATMAGHLIECGTQVTGGYFWDQGADHPLSHDIGPPVASVGREFVQISKPVGGGILNRSTVTEQLLYEIGNPTRYITPDVILDLSEVEIAEAGGQVKLTGARGHPATDTLKSLLSVHTGWFGEAELSYYGTTSGARARQASEVLAKRVGPGEIRIEVFEGQVDGTPTARLRLAIRTADRTEAETALNEAEALYVNGPSAGGGGRKSLTPLVETRDSLIPRAQVPLSRVEMIP